MVNGISPSSAALSRIINTYNHKLEGSLRRISTGLRVTRPSDDVGNYFRAQDLNRRSEITQTVGRNLQDHIARLSTAETALGAMGDLMEKMTEIARKASNEDSAAVRAGLGREFDTLREAMDTIVNTTRYRGELLLTGLLDTSAGGQAMRAQVDEDAADIFSYQILDSRTTTVTGLALSTGAQTSWADADNGKSNALSFFNQAKTGDSGIKRLERNISRIGTNLSVLNAARTSMENRTSNYAAASSALVGVDQAAETSRFATLQIKQQAAASFLAQSNISQSSVIGILAQVPFH